MHFGGSNTERMGDLKYTAWLNIILLQNQIQCWFVSTVFFGAKCYKACYEPKFWPCSLSYSVEHLEMSQVPKSLWWHYVLWHLNMSKVPKELWWHNVLCSSAPSFQIRLEWPRWQMRNTLKRKIPHLTFLPYCLPVNHFSNFFAPKTVHQVQVGRSICILLLCICVEFCGWWDTMFCSVIRSPPIGIWWPGQAMVRYNAL